MYDTKRLVNPDVVLSGFRVGQLVSVGCSPTWQRCVVSSHLRSERAVAGLAAVAGDGVAVAELAAIRVDVAVAAAGVTDAVLGAVVAGVAVQRAFAWPAHEPIRRDVADDVVAPPSSPHEHGPNALPSVPQVWLPSQPAPAHMTDAPGMQRADELKKRTHTRLCRHNCAINTT